MTRVFATTTLSWATLSLAAAFLASSLVAEPPASPESEPRVSQTTLDLIQRECLRAYPADLLAKMAAGSGEIPTRVEEDPKAQMQFLSKEVPLDKGLFYPSLLEELAPAFERYISSETRFLDLGSGDGRAVFLANLFGADATGIEYDEKMVKTSRRVLGALGDVLDIDRIHFIQGDFFASSWSGYDVIYYFDQSSFAQEQVREKLENEVDLGARLLIGHEQAPFPGFELEAVFPAGKRQRHPEVKVYRRVESTRER